MHIAVLGATGPLGRGLTARFAVAGHRVVVGSRDAERARAAADDLHARWPGRLDALEHARNADAVDGAEVVVLAVPWEASAAMARELSAVLAGRVVVCVANAVGRQGEDFAAVVPEGGSVAATVQKAAPESRVVAAFHHLPAGKLADLDRPVEADVVLCSDDRGAAGVVAGLAACIPGVRVFDAGGLVNAMGIEAFTAVLLSLNLRHRSRVGIRLTGIET